ncbi:hypothetical protein [Phenylobacterium sp. SCN 70-31]|uniref:hypothetical protein n=1 Tax=Phenylobacterium sp. SCN 70-31 TaxID=1660129 RepID=UPI0025CF266F|nr:hypothetical protein [Phenylobacterium sp. SCN 70-31]
MRPSAPQAGVGLFLNAIQRVDEVMGETGKGGAPVFAIGGAAVDEAGRLHRFPAFVVAKNFEVGETRRFAGAGRLLHACPGDARPAVLYAADPDATEIVGARTCVDRIADERVRSLTVEPLRPDETSRTLTLTYDGADGRYRVWCSLVAASDAMASAEGGQAI